MNRRSFIKTGAASIAVVSAGTFIKVASRPRCDADQIEARLKRGEHIHGEEFVVRRAINISANKYPKGAKIAHCHIQGIDCTVAWAHGIGGTVMDQGRNTLTLDNFEAVPIRNSKSFSAGAGKWAPTGERMPAHQKEGADPRTKPSERDAAKTVEFDDGRPRV